MVDEFDAAASGTAMDAAEDVAVRGNVRGGDGLVRRAVDKEDVGVVGEGEGDLPGGPGGKLLDLVRVYVHLLVLTGDASLPAEEAFLGERGQVDRVALVDVGHVEPGAQADEEGHA